MKPKNFPGRKNQRRVEALERLKRSISTEASKYPLNKDREERVNRQIEKLEEILAKPFTTHTKKDRSGTAHFTPLALNGR